VDAGRHDSVREYAPSIRHAQGISPHTSNPETSKVGDPIIPSSSWN
jgi:hypothetical protein